MTMTSAARWRSQMDRLGPVTLGLHQRSAAKCAQCPVSTLAVGSAPAINDPMCYEYRKQFPDALIIAPQGCGPEKKSPHLSREIVGR